MGTMDTKKKLALLACSGFFVAFPLLFSNPAVTTIAVFALILAGAATGWNLFSGYTGYISLGYVAFYGIGAYILAIFCQVWSIPAGVVPFFLLPLIGLITSICALPLGWIALKTRRYTFMVITIAIFTLTAQLPNIFSGVFPVMSELSLPIPLWSGDIYNLPFYYVAFALLLLATGVSWLVRHSKYGLNLLAIRDDEERALGLGLRVAPLKLTSFMLSASFVGMAGALNAYFIGFIAPSSAFDRSLNIAIPLMVFLGGTGTLVGPIVGALIIVILQQYLTLQFSAQGLDLILYGVLFLIVILLLPEGIFPTLSKHWASYKSLQRKPTGMEIVAETVEALPFMPAIPTEAPLAVASTWGVTSPALPELIQEVVSQKQPSTPMPVLIPRRYTEISPQKGLTQRVRAQRLVSLPQGQRRETPVSTSTHHNGTAQVPFVGWPCPRCNEPLKAWGETYFCTHCGLRLSTPRGK